MIRKITFLGVVCMVLTLLCLYGCGRGGSNGGEVLVTINGEPVYVKDFNRSLALNFKKDPLFRFTPQALDNQVSMLIDRVLLIQEARKKQLDRTERFINTIKTFWEQTLIRDLLDNKEEEMSVSVVVEEKDIRDYYNKLSPQEPYEELKEDLRKKLLASKKQKILENWLVGVQGKAKIKIDDKVLKGVRYKYE